LLSASTSNTHYAVGTAFKANQTLYWRVKTNSGNYIYLPKGYLSFETGNPPSTPTLSSPANNGLVTNYTPLLDWSDVTLPTGVTLTDYQIQVSTDSSFTTPSFIDTTTSQSNEPVSTALSPNTKYYWRVQAIGSNGNTSNWTSANYFRAAMLPPTLSAPPNTLSPAVVTFRPGFSWNTATGASAYTIQISKSKSFASTLVNVKVSATSYTPTSDLPLNTVLYWRVRSEGTNGPSLWSDIWNFTSADPPSTPILSSPTGNKVITDYTPTLDWSDSILPTGVTLSNYHLQVSTDSTFKTASFIDTTTTASKYPVDSPSLTPNTKYYWRVQALGSNQHYSDWTGTADFRAAVVQPVLSQPANGELITTTLPSFGWNSISGASSYTLQVAATSAFASSLLKKTVTTSTYKASTALPAHSTLYWRIQASGKNGPSLWSQTSSFNTP